MAQKFDDVTKHMHLREGAKSISFDGAAFDANQHLELQEIADATIWHLMKPWIAKRISNWPGRSEIMQSLETFWTKFEADWYLQGDEFETEDTKTAAEVSFYNKCWTDRKGKMTVKLTLTGSTFSGHPTLTTLGNTFRSLTYMWYYLEQSGLPEPWIPNNTSTCLAAGDDSVMIYNLPEGQASLISILQQLTASDKKTPDIGLGQCIDKHMIFVRDWRDFDFCSKWCFYDGQHWVVTRDYSKALWNKQEYSGSNPLMANHPSNHAAAILSGLTAEGLAGSWLHELMTQRYVQCANYESSKSSRKDDHLEQMREQWVKEHPWEHGYEHEQLPQTVLDMIDNKLRLNRATVGEIIRSGKLEL